MSGPYHRKLWLWRNFVDGIPEYWAFGNAYPCRLGGGDPLVFGEPCGYALHIESSVGRDYDDDEVLATVMRVNAMQHEAELSTLRTRAERAEARIVELEQAAKRQAAAALAGMNATKAVSSWEMQEARRLKAECSPASVASQRDANERLTNELQAAQSTIAELTATVDAIAACLPGYLYMDPPDGGDVPLAEQVRRMSVDAAIGRKSDALRDFAKDFADEPCAYGDGCPPFAGTRHGTCMNCKARAALGDAK